jgi:hypothetical protein
VLLLVLAAALMFSGDPPIPRELAEVSLPKRMSADERDRNEHRRTLLELPQLNDAGRIVAPAPPPRDPVLALMPQEIKRAAVVAEFNAIVNSDIGALMLDCLFKGADGDERFLNSLRDAGLDPTRNVDRLALIDDAFVVTGSFKSVPFGELGGTKPTTKDYGRQGKIYQWAQPDGGTSSGATWGDQMLIGGVDEASLRTLLDRLDSSNGRPPSQALTEEQAYGEVFGVVTPEAISELIAPQDQQLADTFRSAAKSVQLHADVSHDVGLVADIDGADSQKTEQLRRALGGALSLGRMQAQAKGRADEAELLDSASVAAAGNGRFRMQAGLPYEYMKKVFQGCVDRKHSPQPAPADANEVPLPVP